MLRTITPAEITAARLRRMARDPLSLRLGTWERRDRVWSKFRREQIINGLPQRDADYRDALKFNRAVAR